MTFNRLIHRLNNIIEPTEAEEAALAVARVLKKHYSDGSAFEFWQEVKNEIEEHLQ